MYELLTLEDRGSVNRKIAGVTEVGYWGRMQQEAIAEIRTNRRPEYSRKLRELIRHCLRISPRARPTVERIHSNTSQHLAGLVRAVENPDTGLRDGTRVYYMGNEINDMPIGQASISYSPTEFAISNDRKFIDPELESLREGRWDPINIVRHGEDLPAVPGGRKRPQAREAHIFMPDRDCPRRLVKRVRLTSDLDYDSPDEREESEGWSGDDDDDGGDNSSRGMPIAGMANPGRGKGKGKGNFVGGNEAQARQKDDEAAGEGAEAGDHTNPGARTERPDQRIKKDSHELARERLFNKAEAERPRSPSTPSSPPTRPGHSQKTLPGQSKRPEHDVPTQPPPSGRSQSSHDREETEEPPRDPSQRPPSDVPLPDPPPRPSGGGGKGGAAAIWRPGSSNQPPHPPPRHADHEIVQQHLSDLQTRNVGGRALRPRK